MYGTEQSKETGHFFLNNLLVEGLPSGVQSWWQYGGLANLLGRHLERDHMELFSLLHWEKVAIGQRKEKPELATSITEVEAGPIESFEGCTFSL